MSVHERETCDEFSTADQAAEDNVMKLFFLMQQSNKQAIADVLEFFESLSRPEGKSVIHKLNVMPKASEEAIQNIRRLLIVLLTPLADPFFAPRVIHSVESRKTRFPDELRDAPLLSFAS